MGKFGFSFSAKRALGISAFKGKVARATGIPTTKSGRQQKIGRMMGFPGWFLLRRKQPIIHEVHYYYEPQKPSIIVRLFKVLIGLPLFLLGLALGVVAVAAWQASTTDDTVSTSLSMGFGVASFLLMLIGIRLLRG